MPMKNSNDTIENRTRDLPACSAVPQPTAPPRAPYLGATALVGQGLIIIEESRSHSDTPQTVELLWASEQPDA